LPRNLASVTVGTHHTVVAWEAEAPNSKKAPANAIGASYTEQLSGVGCQSTARGEVGWLVPIPKSTLA